MQGESLAGVHSRYDLYSTIWRVSSPRHGSPMQKGILFGVGITTGAMRHERK